MKSACLFLLLPLALPASGQQNLPDLRDGSVVSGNQRYQQNGPLRISGHVKLKGISLDLRGPVLVAKGAKLELDHVAVHVSDPPGTANGTSSLRCEGPATITIHQSTMTVEGSAHPIWWLQGDVTVNGFETKNSEFHLDHVHADFRQFEIFELEISHESQVVGRNLELVFLSTHTADNERLDFADIPADRPFSKKLRMGSSANADLSDTTTQFFLLYVHGSSDVSLSRIGRAQLAIAPSCRGTFTLPHGNVGSPATPIFVPAASASDCPFRLRLTEVNADTWDVYAGDGADLVFTDSVIDELTASGKARINVRNSEVYADWLSLTGESQLKVAHSTVGAQRLASQRPDLATSQIRLSGHSQASFDQVKFDCGIVADENSSVVIRNSVTSPGYIRRSRNATVNADPPLPVEDLRKGQ
jgi:hypothetical protein